MKRLFIALDLSDDALDALESLQEACRAQIPSGVRMRWTPRENMHLTLKFLGSTEEDLIESLCETIDELAARTDPLSMQVEHLGAFPHPRRPRILWAGVDRDSAERLGELHRQFEDELESEYEIDRDEHPFKAHVTYGRVKSSKAPKFHKIESDLPEGPYGTTEVAEIILYESELDESGATHRVLHRSPLGD
jgi:2'-5' RNA ligase